MDNNFIIGMIILVTLIFLFINNYKLLFIEKMQNNFTDSSNCCGQHEIDKCNSYGKTCVCDYFKKNSYFCQSAF
tara:strand:- start:50 stop:271 length:222 start_codon:yes stop_codon:yes gene_type:complete